MNLSGELRYALRSLARSPVFAAVAILSLALGIGANTAVFTMLDHVLLHALPVPDPDELVQLKEVGDFYGSNAGMNSLSYPNLPGFPRPQPGLQRNPLPLSNAGQRQLRGPQ
jgi:hypothetical protein